MKRCEWAAHGELEQRYHDTEWGVPVHDDRLLFEFLVLEGMQAGLSWSTVLAKREAFRKAFDNFVPDQVAAFSERKIQALLQNPGIIRNKLKVNAAVTNARAFLKLQARHGDFDSYIWSFTQGRVITNTWPDISLVPANTPVSDAMSKDLKQKGFKFVGSTICYAFMQAVGMINDHTTDCFRYSLIKQFSASRSDKLRER